MYICFKFNLMKKILLLITFISTNTFAQFETASFEIEKILKPEVNNVSIANIGESLFINKYVVKKDAIEVLSIPEYKIFGVKHNINVGQILPLLGTKDGNKCFLDEYKPLRQNIYFGIMYDNKSQKYKAFYTNYLTLSGIGFKSKEVEGIVVKEVDHFSQCNSCYSYEFIYNGKSNNTLKFIYREFIKDLARPSFTQELQYNLDESNIVGFKNMRLEVIKATNSEIEYKILQHLN